MSLRAVLHDWMLHLWVSERLDVDDRQERRRRVWPLRRKVLPWLGWFLAGTCALLLLPRDVAPWLHVALLLALLPPLGMLGWLRVREVLSGDELEQRIQLLAMAIAFVAALCVLLLLVLLRMLGNPLPIRPLVAFYALFFGYVLVERLVRAHFQ